MIKQKAAKRDQGAIKEGGVGGWRARWQRATESAEVWGVVADWPACAKRGSFAAAGRASGHQYCAAGVPDARFRSRDGAISPLQPHLVDLDHGLSLAVTRSCDLALRLALSLSLAFAKRVARRIRRRRERLELVVRCGSSPRGAAAALRRVRRVTHPSTTTSLLFPLPSQLPRQQRHQITVIFFFFKKQQLSLSTSSSTFRVPLLLSPVLPRLPPNPTYGPAPPLPLHCASETEIRFHMSTLIESSSSSASTSFQSVLSSTAT